MIQTQPVNNFIYGILTYPYLHRLITLSLKMSINPMLFVWLLLFHTLVSLIIYQLYPGYTDAYHYFFINLHCLQKFVSFVTFLSIFKLCIYLASNFFSPYILCVMFSIISIVIAQSISPHSSNEFVKIATFIDELIKATSAMLLVVDFIALMPFLFDTMSQLTMLGVHLSIGAILLGVTISITILQYCIARNDSSHQNDFYSIFRSVLIHLAKSCFVVFFGVTFISLQLGTAGEPNIAAFIYDFSIQTISILLFGKTSQIVIEYHSNQQDSLFFKKNDAEPVDYQSENPPALATNPVKEI